MEKRLTSASAHVTADSNTFCVRQRTGKRKKSKINKKLKIIDRNSRKVEGNGEDAGLLTEKQL